MCRIVVKLLCISLSQTGKTSPPPTSPSPTSIFSKTKLIEGYAVVALPSQTKVEIVRKAFLKTKWLNLSSGDESEDSTLEVLEENLLVQTVNQVLLTEPEANAALESYLQHKLFTGAHNKAIGELFSSYLCKKLR